MSLTELLLAVIVVEIMPLIWFVRTLHKHRLFENAGIREALIATGQIDE